MTRPASELTARPDVLPLDASAPDEERLRTATLALGCFWGPDARFGAVPGVVRTRVGYTGGATHRPTYHDLGEHVETVQVDYDPSRVRFEELLSLFWEGHDPTHRPLKRQYISAIFVDGPEQREAAETSRERRGRTLGVRVVTEIHDLDTFWLAEGYHQKYRLRQRPGLMGEFRRVYATGSEFLNSTVAARLNAFAGGHGTRDLLEREIAEYGLSREAEKILRRLVG